MDIKAAVFHLWRKLILHFAPCGDDDNFMSAPRKF